MALLVSNLSLAGSPTAKVVLLAIVGSLFEIVGSRTIEGREDWSTLWGYRHRAERKWRTGRQSFLSSSSFQFFLTAEFPPFFVTAIFLHWHILTGNQLERESEN